MSELHILNGDYALKLWQDSAFSGESLVWQETYLEGPLPETDDLHIFRSARAEFLSHFAELSGITSAKLYQHLQNMDEKILNLPPAATVMLWFDACIFDQTILMRILDLLCRKHPEQLKVFLYCCNGNCLTAEDFKQGISKKIQLQTSDFELAARAWSAFVRKDAAAMMRTAEQGAFERLPAMKKALLRCAEEVPAQDGLTRTQRQILQILSRGSLSFPEIFTQLDAFEENPFLGDTACLRILDDLHQKGLIEMIQENRWRKKPEYLN